MAKNYHEYICLTIKKNLTRQEPWFFINNRRGRHATTSSLFHDRTPKTETMCNHTVRQSDSVCPGGLELDRASRDLYFYGKPVRSGEALPTA